MRHVDIPGLRVSRIGLGTWQFGSREWGYGDAWASEVAPALVREALALGITMIDTAEVYGWGRSERIIADALAAQDGAASDVLVATKFMPVAPVGPIVARQAHGSLRRLATDALDLWYQHWPNPFVRSSRVMREVRPLVEAGRVRRVGVSNHSLARWRDAERGLGAPVVANQVRFNLVSRAPARELVPFAAGEGRLIVAYSPLGQGLLAPRAGDAAPGARGVRALDRRFTGAGWARLAPLRAALREVAAAHGATPAQVALAWVLHHPQTVAIPGARTVEQLRENAAAADLDLAPDELARLAAAATAAGA